MCKLLECLDELYKGTSMNVERLLKRLLVAMKRPFETKGDRNYCSFCALCAMRRWPLSKRFPDIRLSGIRQSDFCLSTYAYHTFAYQDLCLSEAEFEIRTIAHQGGTSAYQKLKYFCEYFCLCLYCLHIAKSEWRNKERGTL